MKFLSDTLSFLAQCMVLLETKEPKAFSFTLLAALLLAATFWWVCSRFSHLWNTRWQVKPLHHLLCAVAALITLFAVVVFAGLKFAKEAALLSIQAWEFEINNDAQWSQSVFQQAYDRVKTVGMEDFSSYPPPSAGGRTIPTTQQESILAVAETYADEAGKHFTEHRPYLGRVVWPPSSRLPRDVIVNDVNEWFQHTHDNYKAEQAISLAASQIKSSLDAQTPRVIYVSRLLLVGVFFFVQAVPFGLVGYAAYTDLKVMT